uniref:Putative Hyaluronan/mRNA-binding protein n=1 Tax=Davidia involucrata TaxID=16924 RepID=A0A5B7BP35_DAVIN
MATTNPFDLLGDDDNDDPSQLIAAQQQKLPPPPKKSPAPAPAQAAAAAQPSKPAKLPSKPLPPAQAVKEGRNEGQRGGGRGGGHGSSRGRGGGGFNRDSVNNENSFDSNNGFSGGYRPTEEGDAGKPSERRGYGGPRGGFRGGRRGGFSNGEVAEGERPRRVFERRSGTGRGNEVKRDGAGHGNWGTPTDEIVPETEEPVNDNEKNVDAEKQLGQEDAGDANKKENPVNEPEEKEPEDKEMTLEEYEKVLEEKRKALLALKTKERKVNLDKELESMQLLSSKKDEHDIFIKLGSDKDKRKEAAEKEDRAKKSVSINEFLKPAEGERYYNPGGRGRGRGRGFRGGFSGSNMMNNVEAPSIEDAGQFPSLGLK